MKRALAIAVAMLALPLNAHAASQSVSVQFQDYGPNQVDALPGDSVTWTNVSERTHTVTADDGSFDSGDLLSGNAFTRGFAAIGTFTYHCTIHPAMAGEIDVRAVTLGPLPTAAVPSGNNVDFGGRSAEVSQPVEIQQATSGGDFRTVATAAVAPDGSWSAKLPATTSGDYRASVAGGVSETRHLLVSDRKVLVRRTRAGVSVTVTPALPYARVMLQERLRERFGWWPVATKRLDYVSQATFRVKHHGRVRVVLVSRDGWTPLAMSPVAIVGRRG